MFGKKKEAAPVAEQPKEKPTPAYLREDYPYKAIGEPITDLDSLVQTGVLYEIKCPKCEMSSRSQGCNIKSTYERMMNGVEVKNEDGTVRVEGGKGCIGCGNKELVVKMVDMSRMGEVEAARKAEAEKEDKTVYNIRFLLSLAQIIAYRSVSLLFE